MRPWLVTADEIPDPHHLRIQLWVNQESQPRQDVDTADMGVKIPEMIARASRHSANRLRRSDDHGDRAYRAHARLRPLARLRWATDVTSSAAHENRV
jgi:hypothetical protein